LKHNGVRVLSLSIPDFFSQLIGIKILFSFLSFFYFFSCFSPLLLICFSGTSQGKASARTATNGGYEKLREATIRHAMIGQLKNPVVGYEELISEHFLLKGNYICTQISGWIEEAESNQSMSHQAVLKKLLSELKVELAKLGDPPPAALEKKYTYTRYEF